MPQYVDLRHIVVKSQIGGYTTFNEIVHDLRQIVYSARRYLGVHPHVFLTTTTAAFAAGLETVLGDPGLFGDWDFSHITGCPGERLAK